MPTVPRLYSIQYGLLTVGGSSDIYLLDGSEPIRLTEAYDKATISFQVTVVGDSAANFKTNCLALEDAYRIPRQATLVVLDSQTIKSWSHSASTGYSAVPSCRKVGNPKDTARSRLYECSIEVERPADLSGQSGRRTSTTTLIINENCRRAVTISGTYTAIGGTSARVQYASSSPAFFASVLSVIAPGAIMRKVHEDSGHDDPNKNLSFNVAYEEILAGDQLTGITRPILVISRQLISPGDSPGKNARRLITIRCSFSGFVDLCSVNVSQSGRIWDNTVVPWIVSKVRSVFGISGAAIVENTCGPDVTGNAPMTGSLTLLALGGSNVIEYSRTVDEATDNSGRIIVPAWTGSNRAGYVFGAPEAVQRTLTVRTVYVADNAFGAGSPDISMLDGEAFASSGNWVTLPKRVSEKPMIMGLRGGGTISTVERNTVFTQQYVEKLSSTTVPPPEKNATTPQSGGGSGKTLTTPFTGGRG